jgi:hypothetical protein
VIVTGRRVVFTGSAQPIWGKSMKPPIKRLADLKPSPAPAGAYARPTPKVVRRKSAKVLTDEERAAFLASRPDLAPKS